MAVISVLGTLAGGGLTAAITARSARHSEKAMERQQSLQERANERSQQLEFQREHYRWRREHRQTAYVNFLEAVRATDRMNQDFFHRLQLSDPGERWEETPQREVRERFKSAEHAGNFILLEGPDRIAEGALSLLSRLDSLMQSVNDYAESRFSNAENLDRLAEGVSEAGWGFTAQQQEFISQAREALDEIS